MRKIRTDQLDRLNSPLTPWEHDQIYNGLDVCVTHEVNSVLQQQLTPNTAQTYTFSRSLQGPVIEMRIRGVLIDQARRSEVINELYDTLDFIERRLERIVLDGVGLASFNWRSYDDLHTLFYDALAIPPIHSHGRTTTDRSAREKLESYAIATQLVRHINALADLGDKISVLKTDIDPDGRIRTSYNIAGTSTGRFSSSLSEFGTGGNLQNIEESLRSILIADPGYKFAKFDAKSGESYCVGAIEWNRFGDGAYLDACESGDVHTAASQSVWPELGWTGDRSEDKAIAERPFYRHNSYRFMCKKLGHGSNYGGQPETLAEQTRLPIDVVARFQQKYFAAFPAHQRWQADVDSRLRKLGYLISLTGRERWFFGRRNDPATFREAVAFDPQCSLADLVNTAMLNIWRQGIATVMMQDHDALTFMYREADEAKVISLLLPALVVPLQLENGRVLRIPYDCEVGWNKGHYCCGQRLPECKDCNRVVNLDGLKYWSGHDSRKRQPIRNVLDTVMAKKRIGGSK